MTETTPAPAKTADRALLRARDDIRDHVAVLIEGARREIIVFAPQLDAFLFSNPRVSRALASFAAAHRQNRARILVEDGVQAVRDNDRLVELSRRMSEFVEIRQVGEQHRGIRELFVVTDRANSLHEEDTTRMEAAVRMAERQTAGLLQQRFQEMWDHSEPIAEIRTTGL
jgi:hypothetical protein